LWYLWTWSNTILVPSTSCPLYHPFIFSLCSNVPNNNVTPTDFSCYVSYPITNTLCLHKPVTLFPCARKSLSQSDDLH
jgi:hypothetical protein